MYLFFNFLTGSEVTVATKVILEPTIQPVEQIPQDNNTISAYAAFMQGFRAFHESAFQRFLAYWPVMRNATRDVLAYVGLDGVSPFLLLFYYF